MKFGILALLISLAPSGVSAASNVSINIDGESFVCQKSASDTKGCRCVEDNAEIDLRLNGKEVKYWSGNTAQSLVECAKFALAQDYCSREPAVICACQEDGAEIDFRLNGKEVKYWSSSTAAQNMIECQKHLRAQSYCK